MDLRPLGEMHVGKVGQTVPIRVGPYLSSLGTRGWLRSQDQSPLFWPTMRKGPAGTGGPFPVLPFSDLLTFSPLGSLDELELAEAGGLVDIPADRVIAVAARLQCVADVLRADHVQRRRAAAGGLDRPPGNVKRPADLHAALAGDR